MNESNNESEKEMLELELNSMSNLILGLEKRVIALERALKALLKKEEMSKLNLSGGDGEWY